MRELDADTTLEDACSASQMLPGSLASAKTQFDKYSFLLACFRYTFRCTILTTNGKQQILDLYPWKKRSQKYVDIFSTLQGEHKGKQDEQREM